jgi:hypothetical protein
VDRLAIKKDLAVVRDDGPRERTAQISPGISSKSAPLIATTVP